MENNQIFYSLIKIYLSLFANEDLLDADLLEMVATVAKQATSGGDERIKAWLPSLKNQLRELLKQEDQTEGKQDIDDLENILQDSEGYLEVLLNVIQKIAQTSSDPQVVYPLLAENIDQLDEHFIVVLSYWFVTTIEEASTNEAEYMAALVVEFSNLIKLFPMADKGTNLEIAITGYELVLDTYQRLDLWVEWAIVQNNLGLAYAERIMGDKAKNQEKAIAAYHDALTVRTRAELPQDWAMTQNNLGTVYAERIMGDKAKNQEKAITAYHDALTVRTRAEFPQDWAMTQNNLGTVYAERIMGNKAENQEKAIAAYHDALQVYTPDVYPWDWAMTHNNLGDAYHDRILGDKKENIQAAIASYNQALEIYNQ